MPKQKAVRQRTNSVRKKPLRDEQEQYRHDHGLTTLDLSLRQSFQIQMTAANRATQTLSKNISDLLCLSLVVSDAQLLNEIKVLKAMQSSVKAHIETYYFRQ